MLPSTPALWQYCSLRGLNSYLQRAEQFEIDGVLVDAANIVRRRFRCDGASCLREKKAGHGRGSEAQLVGDCCHHVDIWLAPGEAEKLLPHLPGIMPFMTPGSRQLMEERLRRYRDDPTLAFSRPAPVLGEHCGDVVLRRQGREPCVFRYIGRDGERPAARCAIHSYLLSTGLPFWDVKPVICWAWPLALQPLIDGRLLLTLHGPETHDFTGESTLHATARCLRVQPPDAPRLYEGLAEELRRLLGEGFYQRLEAVADGLLEAESAG